MNEKTKNNILLVINILLIAFSIIFLCISIFSETKNTNYLIIALACSTVANLLNVTRIKKQQNKKSTRSEK